MQLPQLLPLLLLLHAARSATVHEVSVSVRSVRSVRYRGVQVSIFQHTSQPRRYFFQPLSFFEQQSVRRTSAQRVHLDVYMWTDDFLREVEAFLPDAESIELLPLTQLRLAWSPNAPDSLGEAFSSEYRILGDWRDADKPHMRTTFAVACASPAACERLELSLNGSVPDSSFLFDLQYRVPLMKSRNATVAITSDHLNQSASFQQLRRFAEASGRTQILVPAEVADSVAEEALAAAVTQLQRNLRQEVAELNSGFHHLAIAQLQQLLREDAVYAVTKEQWQAFTFWPSSRRNLRPDRLAQALNALFESSATQAMAVRPKANAAAMLEHAASSLPREAANQIGDLVRAHLPPSQRQLPVAEVQQLAKQLRSVVDWSSAEQRFQPPSRCLLFRLDPRRLAERGVLLLQEASVLLRASQHDDEVRPMSADSGADFSSSSLRSELTVAQQQLLRLQRNLTRQEAAIRGVAQQLQSWVGEFAPGSTQLRSSSSDGSSGGSSGEGGVQRQLEQLQLQVKQLRQLSSNSSGWWQPKFADRFCVLADRRDPPNAFCRTLSYIIPRKSLRHNPFFDRRIRYQANTVGSSFFQPVDGKFMQFSLRICCIS